jgi:stage III sporulation protein AE
MDVRRILKFIIIFAVAFYTLPFLTFANEVEAVIPEDAWNGFKEGIPEGVQGYFEGGAFENEENYFNAIEKMTAPKAIVTALLELFGAEAGTTFRLLLLIIGVLLISAVLCVVGEQSENKTLLSVIRFCSLGAIFSSAGYAFYMHFERLEEFFSQISVFINGMIPVTASIWALGGNVTTATAGSATLYCFLTVFEKLWAASAIPVFSLILILGLCDVLCSELKTVRVLGTVKKIYGFFLGLVMTVLLSSMSAQTAICSAADSTTARTARLVSGSVIPVLGGGVGETLRTVAGGVTYLKSVIGIGGIIMIFLLLLPVGLSVLLTRFVFLITGGLADILGCPSEARLLENLGEVYGCMLAVISGVAITFILALCIFTQTVVAVA